MQVSSGEVRLKVVYLLFICQDRVIINRLDSICQAVLKGKWPGPRRFYEPGGAVASFYTTKLLDNANSLSEDPSASPQGSKVTKHVAENKEFSVKLNDVCLISPFLPLPPSASALTVGPSHFCCHERC